MKASYYQDQVHTLLGMIERGYGDESESTSTLDADKYRSVEQLEREKTLFRRLPILVAHSTEITCAGDYVVRELDDRSWLIVRGDDGVARAFLNYCQHRGTKLVQDDSGCKKRFSCPYHAWTYNVKGRLIGVPRSDLFPAMEKSEKGLKAGHLEERHGFLWLTQELHQARSVDAYLGGLNDEMTQLDLGSYAVYFDRTRTLDANWKLPIFAFLESYHISTLHRESIAEYFVENIAFSEQFAPHIRSFVPRKNVTELADSDLDESVMSEFITPTNIVFPNVCMIAHPTSYTVISMFPGETPGQSTWRHILLVPKMPETDAEKAHYDKTVAVLDGITYEKEDFWISEQIQQGINAGAIDELILAKNEMMLKVFSDTIDDWLIRLKVS